MANDDFKAGNKRRAEDRRVYTSQAAKVQIRSEQVQSHGPGRFMAGRSSRPFPDTPAPYCSSLWSKKMGMEKLPAQSIAQRRKVNLKIDVAAARLEDNRQAHSPTGPPISYLPQLSDNPSTGSPQRLVIYQDRCCRFVGQPTGVTDASAGSEIQIVAEVLGADHPPDSGSARSPTPTHPASEPNNTPAIDPTCVAKQTIVDSLRNQGRFAERVPKYKRGREPFVDLAENRGNTFQNQ